MNRLRLLLDSLTQPVTKRCSISVCKRHSSLSLSSEVREQIQLCSVNRLHRRWKLEAVTYCIFAAATTVSYILYRL